MRRPVTRSHMLLGYNTNGFAHHDPFEALEILAEIGYRSVALTLDHGPLNPFAADWPANLQRLKETLRRLGLRSVIETGARFLLDPRHKHEPTLVSAERGRAQRRIDFLQRAIDAAAFLDSDCVSLWSGIRRDDAPRRGRAGAAGRVAAGGAAPRDATAASRSASSRSRACSSTR